MSSDVAISVIFGFSSFQRDVTFTISNECHKNTERNLVFIALSEAIYFHKQHLTVCHHALYDLLLSSVDEDPITQILKDDCIKSVLKFLSRAKLHLHRDTTDSQID